MQVLIANNNTIEWSLIILENSLFVKFLKKLFPNGNHNLFHYICHCSCDFIALTTLDILICPIQSYDIYFKKGMTSSIFCFLNLIQKDHELCDLSHLSKF